MKLCPLQIDFPNPGSVVAHLQTALTIASPAPVETLIASPK